RSLSCFTTSRSASITSRKCAASVSISVALAAGAGVRPGRAGDRWAFIRDVSCAGPNAPSSGARFLLCEQRAIDVIREADAAGLGERLRIFVAQERTPHAGGSGAAERAFAIHAGVHLTEHRVEEDRFEIGRLGAGLGLEIGRRLGAVFAHGER